MTGSTTTSGVKRSSSTNQGILVVGSLQETPTNPNSRERKPRRASLAASAKWNVLKNNKNHNSHNSTVHHPTSPSSNATSGRQSGVSGNTGKQLSPASLSTGTISLDGSSTGLAEAGSLVRIPNCHSDGSNTSGVDSVVEKSNNNNNNINNNVIINSEKMMKTTTTMLGNDKNDVNNTQNEMNNTNKP